MLSDMFFALFGQQCAQLPNKYNSGHMKDFLDNGLRDYSVLPTLYAISVLHHLDLKTHFDNHCIFSESMFVLLEKKERNYKVNWIA